MDMNDKLILQRMHVKLRNTLACDGDLLAELMAIGLLSAEDKRHVTMGTNHMPRDAQERTDVLLEMLPHLGKDAFKEFQSVLSKSTARRNRDLAEELWTRKYAPSSTYQGRAVTETIIDAASTAHTAHTAAAAQPSDPLTIALRSTAWSAHHTNVLLEVLSTPQLRALMARLAQAFPVQCTDANGRADSLPQPRVGLETVTATCESDRDSGQHSADIREYRGAVVIKPNQAPLSFNVVRPPPATDTEYDPWTSEIYLSRYTRLVEILPPDVVRPIAMAQRAITDQQHTILSARDSRDRVGHNEILLRCVEKSSENSYATLLVIICQLGPNFSAVYKDLAEALVKRPPGRSYT